MPIFELEPIEEDEHDESALKRMAKSSSAAYASTRCSSMTSTRVLEDDNEDDLLADALDDEEEDVFDINSLPVLTHKMSARSSVKSRRQMDLDSCVAMAGGNDMDSDEGSNDSIVNEELANDAADRADAGIRCGGGADQASSSGLLTSNSAPSVAWVDSDGERGDQEARGGADAASSEGSLSVCSSHARSQDAATTLMRSEGSSDRTGEGIQAFLTVAEAEYTELRRTVARRDTDRTVNSISSDELELIVEGSGAL